jgi:hypothetical protein
MQSPRLRRAGKRDNRSPSMAMPKRADLWATLLRQSGVQCAEDTDALRMDLLGLRLQQLPTWALLWARNAAAASTQRLDHCGEADEDMAFDIINKMWSAGCAVVITAIWRWQVDLVYTLTSNGRTREAVTATVVGQLNSLYQRQSWRYLPLIQTSQAKYRVAFETGRKLRSGIEGCQTALKPNQQSQVGFFDGGSRGNPGAGGAGASLYQNWSLNSREPSPGLAASHLQVQE